MEKKNGRDDERWLRKVVLAGWGVKFGAHSMRALASKLVVAHYHTFAVYLQVHAFPSP